MTDHLWVVAGAWFALACVVAIPIPLATAALAKILRRRVGRRWVIALALPLAAAACATAAAATVLAR